MAKQADYENERLANVDYVEYEANSACYDTVSQTDTSFTLGTGDKVFVWEDFTSLRPLCTPYVISNQ